VVGAAEVGREPCAVAVDPLTGRAYVTDTRGDAVTVIDTRTHEVTDRIRVGRESYGIAVDPPPAPRT
jgi:YVTN family beta-propeller protein